MEKFFHDAKNVLGHLVEICKYIVKIALPVGGGLVCADILFGTKFGVLQRLISIAAKVGIEGEQVTNFYEKLLDETSFINGGFFIFNKRIEDYLDDEMLETNTLPNLAKDGELMAYKHMGYWQCVNISRDKAILENEWKHGNPKWKVW